MKIKIKSHPVFKEIKILNFTKFSDLRGGFSRIFCLNYLRGLNFSIKQVNYSTNTKIGTLRGMHMLKYSSKEKKIVTCLSGEIYDVIVDMRKYSKTYKKIISIRLNANNQIGIYIPNGFAHGFQTQKKNTIVIYFHSAFYKKDLEKNINPFDPKINIKWPLKVSNISKKDLNS